VICSSAIFHRALIEKVIGFPEAAELKALEDYALWLRVATCTDFAFVMAPLVIYSDNPEASIREHITDERAQRKSVFADFAPWAAECGQRSAVALSQNKSGALSSSRKKNKLNILHTVEFYYPHIGGSETVVQQLSERLTRRGHKVTVATTRLAERDFAELNGVTIREFDVSGNLATGLHGADARPIWTFSIRHSLILS
jgi:hypothetical protein